MKTLPILLLLAAFLPISARGQCDPDHPCRSAIPNPNFNGRGQTYDGPPTTSSQEPHIVVFPPPVIFRDAPQPTFAPAPPDLNKLLDKHGPQFADVFSMSSFSVVAYAKGGWPLVIDYQQEKESFALLVVAAEGIDPFYYRLQGSNKAGHFQEIVRLPQRFGDKPLIAHYFVRALGMNTGEVKPTHLHIFGLGAGDKAVASVGIDRIVFQPGAIRPPQDEKAVYTFHSEFDFPEVQADVMKVGVMNNQIIATSVNQNRIKDGIRQNTEVSRNWDGKRKGKPCQGQHVLQVRAWRSSHDGGDWVAAWSQQLVEVVP